MLNFTPWSPTTLAVALAVAAAVCLAYGAFLQQRAVADAATSTTGAGAATDSRVGVGLDCFRRLIHQPRWLAGGAMVAVGVLMHALALLLAPVSVVQPIGVLAVPVAVLLAARYDHVRPGRSVVTGVALAVAGTGAFVLFAGRAAPADPSPGTVTGLLVALLIVAAVTTCLAVMTRIRTGLVRCLGYASIGAVSFGFGSALINVLGRAVADGSGLVTPLTITSGITITAALAVGAWSVQQAYAAGSSAVVLGALTVGDPLVAILLSAGPLGGGLSLAPVVGIAMVGCAAASAAGVRLLASHHPAALPAPNPGSLRELAPLH